MKNSKKTKTAKNIYNTKTKYFNQNKKSISKIKLVLLVLSFIFVFPGCGGIFKNEIQNAVDVTTGIDALQQKIDADKNIAIIRAEALYKQMITQVDFTDGPCLSNDIIPGWVVDIAHNPREAVDDLPENQCSAYLDGEATHFVELTPDGALIRAQ